MNKGHLESFHVPRTRCNKLKANLLKTDIQKPSACSFWSPFCRIPLSTNMNFPSMTKNVPLATLCLLFWGLGGAPSSAQTSVQADSTAEKSGWWKGLFRQTVPDAKSSWLRAPRHLVHGCSNRQFAHVIGGRRQLADL